MAAFLIVFFSIYGAMHAYALRKAWLVLPHSAGLAFALAATGLLLTASPLLAWWLQREGARFAPIFAWIAYSWMGFLFLFTCTAGLLDLGHGAAALLSRPWLTHAGDLAAAGSIALALTVYGYFEAGSLRVEQVRIASPKLASGAITLAQVSDLHLGSLQSHAALERVMAKVRDLRPDVLVATGDIVDGRGDDVAETARLFHSYEPPLGAFAVTGNHEYITGVERSIALLEAAGFTVLRGTSVRVGPVVLTGVDDRGALTPPARAARVRPAIPSHEDFVVLLKHQPVVNGEPAFDLQLSGHVHGGQVFPFGVLTRLAYRVGTGLTKLPADRWLYVSRGAGTWGPPIRVLAPPEITLITLVPGPQALASRPGANGPIH